MKASNVGCFANKSSSYQQNQINSTSTNLKTDNYPNNCNNEQQSSQISSPSSSNKSQLLKSNSYHHTSGNNNGYKENFNNINTNNAKIFPNNNINTFNNGNSNSNIINSNNANNAKCIEILLKYLKNTNSLNLNLLFFFINKFQALNTNQDLLK